MANCYHCGQELAAGPVVRSSECPSCRRDVRVCRNCRHFSPGAHWDCRETVSDQVVDKERANFCDWFKLAGNGASGKPGGQAAEKEKKARDGFAALFGD
jgi:predicted RNA-binding Zn-ribbon protein involved in translation (DUF1610 family)